MVEVVVAVAVAMGKMSYPTVSVLFFVFSTSLERKLQMGSGRKNRAMLVGCGVCDGQRKDAVRVPRSKQHFNGSF